MPRDAGGTITINDGTGPIRTMLSTGDLLFVYKADKTFKVETPETIDPKRTNPSAPFVVSAVENIGCSHWIVARVLLQGYEMLNSCSVSQEEKTAICKQLYKCRESLVRCESVAVRVAARVDAIEKLVQQAGENVLRGRVLTNFPQVENLELDCTTFLSEANRAIKAISGLPRLLLRLEKTDNNFDHLLNRLKHKVGANETPTRFIESVAPNARRLVDMRNSLEHPEGKKKTLIKNFHLAPDGKMCTPIWSLSCDSPAPIGEDMHRAIEFLVSTAEKLLIELIVFRERDRFEYVVQEIVSEQIDQSFPIKYKLMVYFKPPKNKPLSR
jgi:hypothetical protein